MQYGLWIVWLVGLGALGLTSTKGKDRSERGLELGAGLALFVWFWAYVVIIVMFDGVPNLFALGGVAVALILAGTTFDMSRRSLTASAAAPVASGPSADPEAGRGFDKEAQSAGRNPDRRAAGSAESRALR